ncbi:23S rRNA pseudouridine955/2504/2580 synthase [Erythromicrobium ramosum]|uniref:Ribosomal large subunit pseudouridine synthase D n=1 Tax=Erythrobacter ramosus TaxID=35811 RepID=A0A6I4UM50_9SPHN|nr:RluA family pseudouridine synthase [Erythrobacter ramosus]MBB3777122.1 23S rRNA pseudouridine955/2504/2580 synthase [Erythrobacter ramosus]MXP39738.1 RluA family pseudouridine synthase [Erythrobacter ramosus]
MTETPTDNVRQFTVSEDDHGIRLDRWFKRNLPLIGFATVSRWARTGQIRVDGKRAKPEDRLEQGQVLRVPPGGEEAPAAKKAAPRVRTLSPEQIAEAKGMVIRETASAIVLNKPPGLATQGGSKTTKHVDGLLDAFVETEKTPRPRLVHRLDKDTSGVLLIARTPGAAASFSKRFASRSARKVYWALVVGKPQLSEGVIDAPLAKQPGTGGEKMHIDEENGAAAKTRYRVVDSAGQRASWVELEPLTGRTHQLRVHMAAIGHPIVGDGKYGGPDSFLTGAVSRKMHLHARRLIISEPKVGEGTGGKLDVTAELPPHFAMSMEVLGFDQGLSDASPMGDEAPERTGEEKKQAARRHFKQARKEARAPRRARGDAAAKPKAKKPAAKSSGKPAGKPTAKSGTSKAPANRARPTPKPAPKGGGKRTGR